MLILGVDTSGKNGSIALVDFGANPSRTLDLGRLEGGTFSAQLVPQISQLLAKGGLTKRHIHGFAVVSGPGSFTGLRVGLAAIKGLAEILMRPIAAISMLEAVALSAVIDEGRLIAALDAGRSEIYCAEYIVDGWNTMQVNQQVVMDEEFLTLARGLTVVTPDNRTADLFVRAGLAFEQVKRPMADFIARIGNEKIEEGEIVSPEALDATYIRRSEAEIKFAERAK